jgi:arylsulfatase
VYEYFPNTQPVFGRGAVDTLNRDFDIVATIAANPVGVTEGVILAHGNRFGGYTLFIQDEKAHFVYNLCGVREYRVSAPYVPMDGTTEISVIFILTGESEGKVNLSVGDAKPATGVIGATIPYVLPVHSHISCGLDRGLSVCTDYTSPFAFTGHIEGVKVSVGEQGPIDHSKVLRAVLAEQ